MNQLSAAMIFIRYIIHWCDVIWFITFSIIFGILLYKKHLNTLKKEHHLIRLFNYNDVLCYRINDFSWQIYWRSSVHIFQNVIWGLEVNVQLVLCSIKNISFYLLTIILWFWYKRSSTWDYFSAHIIFGLKKCELFKFLFSKNNSNNTYITT